MVVDKVLTLDEAYRITVDGLRNLGWKDMALDSKNRGINSRFEGEDDIWELLIHFHTKEMYQVISRSSWKVNNNTSDLVQHLVEKIDTDNSKHVFRMNDNGSFEVKTTTNIPEKIVFLEELKKTMISNIHAYESYAGMLKRFVNIGPKFLDKETEDFRALITSKNQSMMIQNEELIRLKLQK